MNQYYSRGGIYEPGYSSGSQNNARYNAAVDATWGMTMQRFYPVSGEWRFWRPGFYGSFTVNRDCMVPPVPGDMNVQMRHPSQPSHWRGWSFFPVNADDCARTRNLSVEALLRDSFFSFDSDQVAGVGTSDVADDRFNITAVYQFASFRRTVTSPATRRATSSPSRQPVRCDSSQQTARLMRQGA